MKKITLVYLAGLALLLTGCLRLTPVRNQDLNRNINQPTVDQGTIIKDNKLQVDVNGYLETCTNPPTISVYENGDWKKANTQLPNKGMYFLDDQYYGYGMCDVLVCEKLEKPMEIDLVEYVEVGQRESLETPGYQVPEFRTKMLSGEIKVELSYYIDSDCRNKKIFTKIVNKGGQNVNQPTKTLTYWISREDALKYCNGGDMDSDGYRETITTEVTTDIPIDTVTRTELAKATIVAATTGQCQDVLKQNDLRVEGDTVYIAPIDGWAGVSITMCSCRPQIEVNLLRLPGIKKVVYGQAVNQNPNIDQTDLKSRCCAECGYGASKDVRGMDISSQLCSYYQRSRLVDEAGNEIEILSAECIDYFQNNPLTVSQCR